MGQGPSIVLCDPDGYSVELIGGMDQVSPNYGPRAVQPRKLSHVTLLVDDCKRSAEFYGEVLGFRASDWVDDIFLWMRCNPDHHGLAFAKTDAIRMHHFAFEMVDLSYLVRQAEHLMQNGYQLIYGPGRHGPGATAAGRAPHGCLEAVYDGRGRPAAAGEDAPTWSP